MKLVVTDGEDTVTYNTKDVVNIRFGMCASFYPPHDVYGNGKKPNDICTVISFCDGKTATFDSNWYIFFG